MRAFRRFMTRALLLGIAAFLIVPMVIPFESSGTLTNVEAAGNGEEFAEVNGIQVHIATEEYSGSSKADVPLFILLHGFGASTHSWRFVMKSLSTQGDVLAYDRPAFGYTERPTSWTGANPYGFEGNFELISALIEKFGKGQEIILGGHSAGGQIAAEYGRLNPDKVQRLILVDPAILTTGTGSSWISTLKVIPQVDRLGPFLVRGVASSGKDLLERSYYDKAQLTDEVSEGYFKPLKIKGWEKAFWEFSTAPRESKLAENLTSITQPTLLITGKYDVVVPTADTEKLATLIKNNKLVVVDKSGHLPQEEQPGVFADAVISWVKATSKTIP
ncbi:MAG: alpha/beta hydrolase [Rhodoluna sp.]|nr:alpha/beta hydrolase [Rhodoluna sp.]